MKNLDVEQKHNLKSGKAKIRKKNLKQKRQETKKRENIVEEKTCNWIFWSCSFHERKPKKKEK